MNASCHLPLFPILGLIVSTASAQLTPQPEPANTRQIRTQSHHALVVLDCSGSMSAYLDGRRKADIARDVVRSLLTSLPQDMHLGLLAYGHRRTEDCSDIELLYLPGRVSRRSFYDTVIHLEPLGATPLAASVTKAVEELQFLRDPASVIVVTDGEETCERNPRAVAQRLGRMYPNRKVHVIGFDLTDKESQSVRCFADETGGQFLPARDAASLRHAFDLVIERITHTQPRREVDLSLATLTAPRSVVAGSRFDVSWKGPANRGDYLKVVPARTSPNDRVRGCVRYVRPGPVSMIASIEPGDYEVCYIGPGDRILGRTDIRFTDASATVDGPAELEAGSPVNVTWTGPNNPGDHITIALPHTHPDRYASIRSLLANPLPMHAPTTPGTYEYRYVTGRTAKVLARRRVQVRPALSTLIAPDDAMAGSPVTVRFTGPRNQGDMISMVYPDAPSERTSNAWARTAKSNEVTLTALSKPGRAEIRYIGREGKILARHVVRLTPPKIELRTRRTVMAGSPVLVSWRGPGGKGDHIAIVMANAPDREKRNRQYATERLLEIVTPETPGRAEVRYFSSKGVVLGRQPIELTTPRARLLAPETGTTSRPVSITWTGPGNPRDYIMAVPEGSPDSERGYYQLVRDNETVSLRMPKQPGNYELRYVTAQERKVIGRRSIRVLPR